MSQADKYLDMKALLELKEIMGSEFTNLVNTYLKDSVLRIQAIKEAVDSNDPEQVRRAAHSFKGSSSNMAATRLTELCRQLEEIGLNGSTEGCQALYQDVVVEYDGVSAALEDLASA